MPGKSRAQHNLTEAIAHSDPKLRNKGIPKKVAEEFVQADKGKFKGNAKKAPERVF